MKFDLTKSKLYILLRFQVLAVDLLNQYYSIYSLIKLRNNSKHSKIILSNLYFCYLFLGMDISPKKKKLKQSSLFDMVSPCQAPISSEILMNTSTAREASSTAHIPTFSQTTSIETLPESPYQPKSIKLNQKLSNNRAITFNTKFFDTFSWLHYSPSLNGLLCFICLQAQKLNLNKLATKTEPTFISTGFRNRHVTAKFK